ncbi:hypothetical protein D3C75_1231860 [compost metagenome]
MHQLPRHLSEEAFPAFGVRRGVGKGHCDFSLLTLARIQIFYQVLDVAFVHFLGNDR